MAEVGGNARSVSDIVEAEPAHQWAVLQEEGEGLPNASRGPQHRHLGIVLGKKEEINALKRCFGNSCSSDLMDFTTLPLLLFLFLHFSKKHYANLIA